MADGTVFARAAACAALNPVDGSPLVLAAADIEFGHFADDAFTPNGTTPRNAIRITGQRTRARGNAIPLAPGQVLGYDACDVRATAIAGVAGTAAFGVVGMNNVHLDSDVVVDSYNSASGPYSEAWSPDRGHVGSNGPLQLKSNATIRGDDRRYRGSSDRGGNGHVTGSTAALDKELSRPSAGNDGYGTGNNNNANLPSAYRPGQDFSVTSVVAVTMPAGNYYFRDFTLKDGTLTVTGPATVYLTGTLTVEGNGRTSAHRPAWLRFRLVGRGGNVRFDSNAVAYADVYAPDAPVHFDGNAELFGRLVGKTVHLNSNTKIHVDELLGSDEPILFFR